MSQKRDDEALSKLTKSGYRIVQMRLKMLISAKN